MYSVLGWIYERFSAINSKNIGIVLGPAGISGLIFLSLCNNIPAGKEKRRR